MRADDCASTGLEDALKRWKECLNPEVVRDPAIIDRDVQVGPQQYAPAANV